MNKPVKIGIYAVLLIAALYFGYNFFTRLSAISEPSPNNNAEVEATATPQPAATTTNALTNAPQAQAGTTNTNAAGQTVVINGTNATVVSVVTNEVTNTPSAQTQAIARASSEDEDSTGAVLAKAARGKMWSYLGGFVGVLVILGLLVAYDVTQYLGNRSVDFLFNDDLKGVHDPNYEAAEQMYANGKHLDAIQMLREYLRKNPRQQHAALRIAEIYEKDLGNYLAAALEYEEILKHKLPRERWGWAAIHLCNLYSKLGKSEQTVALLRRVAEEYSETAAAKKARKRLAMYESAGELSALGTDMPEDPNMPDLPPPSRSVAKAPPEEDGPPSNLPPGFRPKK